MELDINMGKIKNITDFLQATANPFDRKKLNEEYMAKARNYQDNWNRNYIKNFNQYVAIMGVIATPNRIKRFLFPEVVVVGKILILFQFQFS